MLTVEQAQALLTTVESYAQRDALSPERLAAAVLLLQERLSEIEIRLDGLAGEPGEPEIRGLIADSRKLVGTLIPRQRAGVLTAEAFEQTVEVLRTTLLAIHAWAEPTMAARRERRRRPVLIMRFPQRAPLYIRGVIEGGRA